MSVSSLISTRHRLLAWGTLIVGVVLSCLMFAWVLAQSERVEQARFEAQADDVRDAIKVRIQSYVDVLLGFAALHDAAKQVSRAQFHRYFNKLELTRRHPGFRLFNFVERVPHGGKQAFELSVRADTSVNPDGYPNFEIRPAGERGEYFVAKYVEPMAGHEGNFGFDHFSEPVRRATLEQARDSGQLTVSGPVAPISTPLKLVGIQLRQPLYRAGAPTDTVDQRREAFVGVVGAGLRMHEFMAGILSDRALAGVSIRMHDAGPIVEGVAPAPADDANLLFDSDPALHGLSMRGMAPVHLVTHSIDVGGRRWHLQFRPTSAFHLSGDRVLAWTLLFGGLFGSALLFGSIHALSSAQRRAVQIAKEMTQDLRASEKNLIDAQRVAKLGIWSYDPASDHWTLSKDISHWMARAQKDDGVRPDFSAIHPRDREGFEYRFHRAVSVGQDFEREFRIMIPGIGARWVHFIARAQPTQDGEAYRLSGTLMDITQRKQSELLRAVEYTATRVLAEQSDEAEAMHQVLEDWCLTLDWDFGARWAWNEADGTLRCVETWGGTGEALREFDLQTRKLVLAHEVAGLTRRAFAHRKPVWIDDVTLDRSYMRAPYAARAGLRSAFAFPILFGSSTLGVLEFHTHETRKADADLIAMAGQLGAQIGQDLQRRKAERNLRHLAGHDALTGLVNRAFFVTQLEHALARARRSGERVAVLFADLDRFKAINDTLGHDAGDHLLRQVAQRFRDNLRQADTVARHGGDEFVVLLEDAASAEGVAGVARKLVESLGLAYRVDGHDCHVTASVGIAVFPDDGDDSAALLRHADFAMYRAKEAGSNMFAFYKPQLNAGSLKRMKMDADLRRAVAREEFVLEYQPKLNLRNHRVTGVEALLRWHHPENGVIPPVEFISLAEEVGLIGEIGRWVLLKALTDALAWRSQIGDVPVAVNLSVRQFEHGDLAAEIADALAQTGAPARLLELEVTESMLIRDPEEAANLLYRIRSMGVKISIDDFGTGYSSLSYLKRLPLDAVKLDRSFVRDLPDDTEDAAISSGVIALAHQLLLDVVAEGVETAAQEAFLIQAGCDQAQGFFYSHPMGAQPLVEWFVARHERAASAQPAIALAQDPQ